MVEELKTYTEEQAASLAQERSWLLKAADALNVVKFLAAGVAVAFVITGASSMSVVVALSLTFFIAMGLVVAIRLYTSTSQVSIQVRWSDTSDPERMRRATIMLSRMVSEVAMRHVVEVVASKRDVTIQSVEPSDIIRADSIDLNGVA